MIKQILFIIPRPSKIKLPIKQFLFFLAIKPLQPTSNVKMALDNNMNVT